MNLWRRLPSGRLRLKVGQVPWCLEEENWQCLAANWPDRDNTREDGLVPTADGRG